MNNLKNEMNPQIPVPHTSVNTWAMSTPLAYKIQNRLRAESGSTNWAVSSAISSAISSLSADSSAISSAPEPLS